MSRDHLSIAVESADLLTRAMRAYAQRSGHENPPARQLSDVCRIGKHWFVVLVNVSGELGRYRVTPDGRLKWEEPAHAA